MTGGAKVVEFAGYRLDRTRRTLTAPDGKIVDLKPKVFDTLAALAERPGVLVDKGVLMNAVWPDVVVEENNLNQAISALRRALGDGETGRRMIVTVPGRGYQFTPEVTTAADELARPSHPSSLAGEPVLAVLAFDNLSGDPDMAFFSDGVSDEILQTVSRALRTIGRASSFQFRGPDKAVRKVASELGVTHVLDGSVRRGGGLIRISAQLIEVASQLTVWRSQYDRPERDLFAVQDEVAAAVATALNCQLSPAPPAGDIDPDTHELYLRIRHMALKQHDRNQVDLADEVTRRAPKFGPGWVEAARARVGARQMHAASDTEARRLYEEALVAASRAADVLGPDDAVLTAIVVDMQPWCGAWTACETRLRRALASSPHITTLIVTLATLLLHAGRLSDARALFRDLYEREPLNARYANQYAIALNGLGLHDEAFAVLEAACRRWPDAPLLWRFFVTFAAEAGRWDIVDRWVAPEAVGKLQQHAAFISPSLHAVETYRHPTDARRQALLEGLANTLTQAGPRTLPSIAFAARFCDPGAVYDLVDRASFEHLIDPLKGFGDSNSVLMFVAHAKRLRDDPRFVKLCARLGLTAHWIETGRWPDCASTAPYDFRAEAHRVASTPLG
jgi:TolB-like protein